jgi:low affinity Fe/Cu permease
MRRKRRGLAEQAAVAISRFAGSGTAFLMAVGLVVLWLVTGPIFGFSNRWQLVINTGTTIVTFLMVFLIRRSQNKESLALQLKLNELVAALEGASNRLVCVEELSEKDLKTLESHYARLAEMAEQEGDVQKSHSVEEAEARHESKLHARGRSAANQRAQQRQQQHRAEQPDQPAGR